MCRELGVIATESSAKSEWIAKPNFWLRSGISAVVLIGLVGLLYSFTATDLAVTGLKLKELVSLTDAGLNSLVLIGAAVLFLVTIETRMKRTRALEAVHELRSIAHVIDMHQLTKDPSRLIGTVVLTQSSPVNTMTAFELTRYLDYCSEMLSLTGKIAALYAQNFHDSVVVSAVTEIEALTTGLSRKIWQKIMILDRLAAASGGSSSSAT